jgi:hypothetical protein
LSRHPPYGTKKPSEVELLENYPRKNMESRGKETRVELLGVGEPHRGIGGLRRLALLRFVHVRFAARIRGAREREGGREQVGVLVGRSSGEENWRKDVFAICKWFFFFSI